MSGEKKKKKGTKELQAWVLCWQHHNHEGIMNWEIKKRIRECNNKLCPDWKFRPYK